VNGQMDSSFLSQVCQLLVIGKHPHCADRLAEALPDDEFEVLYRPTDEVSETLETEWIDVVVIDETIPRRTARAICRSIRRNPRAALVPILLLDEDPANAEAVECLRDGADDFLTLNQTRSVIAGRIKALVRRQAASNAEPRVRPPQETIQVGQLVIKLASYEVVCGGKPVSLGLGEFRLLKLLASKPQQTFQREQLIEALSSPNEPLTKQSLDARLYRLRSALGPFGHYIKNVRGVGYMLKAV